MLRQRRERALHSLLGVSERSHPDEYPDEITLPDPIHRRTVEAVLDTNYDHCERSIRFNYRWHRWVGGVAAKGTMMQESADGQFKASANTISANNACFWPPHVFLHTHPTPSDAVMSRRIDTLSSPYEVTTDKEKDLIAFFAAEVIKTEVRIPGEDDIHTTLHNPFASVAHLIGSASGNFLWVHKDTGLTRGKLWRSINDPYEAHHTNMDDFMQPLRDFEKQNRIVRSKDDVADLIEDAICAGVEALNNMYVCYENEDPNSPTMFKIELEDG